MKSIKKYYQRWNSEISREAQFSGIKKVLATVSGGPDSIALLSLLTGCQAIETIAVHCNFHLRGDESMRDQHTVEDTCSNMGVQLIIKDFDVKGYMSSHKGTSVEMACRELRYDWFREIAKLNGCDRIATGHNADDNIETMLLNLFRGSGTSGLRGMSPDNGEIWRPILSYHRHEIIEYLKTNGLSYIIDSSNLMSDFRRNFLRNEIIPLLRSKWEGLDKAIDRSIRLIREDNKVVNDAVCRNLPRNGQPLKTIDILSFPSPTLLIRRFIEPANPFTTTADEIMAAIHANKPHARIWKLPLGLVELRNKHLYMRPIANED